MIVNISKLAHGHGRMRIESRIERYARSVLTFAAMYPTDNTSIEVMYPLQDQLIHCLLTPSHTLVFEVIRINSGNTSRPAKVIVTLDPSSSTYKSLYSSLATITVSLHAPPLLYHDLIDVIEGFFQ
ncbi:hypothetical protein GEMRC1_010789 [Eukaryota sp. GEM-RC1]